MSDVLSNYGGSPDLAVVEGEADFRQDPADKRRILRDQKLKDLLEVDSFSGFNVPKLLSSNFIKMEQ
ncbi:hypothetical protein QJS10_CPB17g02529 [Acorus calamus]|uniref:DM2 domain-containing protein n=1 Tax=Acorus calamus TaxID=4465 RepID=A0AAV9CR20_ACOCL|nr:hypothetical protein QJS10_CPB17g02529 [Acorus calamus]